jgi:hypothetical protein
LRWGHFRERGGEFQIFMKEIKSPRIKILEPNDKIIRVHAILHALSIGTIEIYNSFVSSNSLFIGWMMNGVL